MKVSLAFIAMLLFVGCTLPTSTYSPDISTNDHVEVEDSYVEEVSNLIPRELPPKKISEFDPDSFIENMTIEQKIGQLLMIGILESEITPNLQKRIKFIKPGFLILFRRNIKTPVQTATLLHEIQKVSLASSGLRVMVSVDQEGGDVVRIPTKPPLPTALALGRSSDLESTYSIGKYIGEVLSVLGIHMNLAPVLDLSDPREPSFIQTRSFGSDPVLVAKISNEFARGVQSSGVVSTAKHFPGLGPLKEDSHKEIVRNNVSKEEFYSHYLKPYEKLIEENSISAVMMTHLVYPNLDPSQKPATFSSPIINILKKHLKFDGLVITDDIEMAGALFYKTPEERAVQAFLAGNDVLMVAWNKNSQVRAYKGLLSAYRSGLITDERLNSSLRKIISLKLSSGLSRPSNPPQPSVILSKLRDDALKQPVNNIFEKILNQELYRLSNKKPDLDLSRVAILSTDYSFYKKFKATYRRPAQFIPITKGFTLRDAGQLLSKYSLLVLNVAGPTGTRLANNLPAPIKKKTLVLNSRFIGSIRDTESFFDVLQISMRHHDLGSYLGSYLDSHFHMKNDFDRNLSSNEELSK